MIKVFFDSDVILDMVLKRKGFWENATALFDLAEIGKIKAYTSPVVVCNLFYILKKSRSSDFARGFLKDLSQFFTFSSLNHALTKNAIFSKYKDLEDIIQFNSATHSNVDYICTRNIKDYPDVEEVVSSGDLVNIL